MTGALFAHDPVNKLRISTQNIWQVRSSLNGSPVRLDLDPATFTDAVKRLQTSNRYPVDSLNDSRARQLWWQVERGRAGALHTLVRASQRSAIQEEAAAILTVVESIHNDREAALIEADPTIDTYEALEQLLLESQGLRLDAAQRRYRELSRDPNLRDEIAARSVYQSIWPAPPNLIQAV